MKRQTEPQGVVSHWVAQPLDVDPFLKPKRYSLACTGRTLTGWFHKIWGRSFFNISDEVIIGKYSVLVRHRIMGRTVRQKRLSLHDFQGVAIRITCLASRQSESRQLNSQKDESITQEESSDSQTDFAISINLHHAEERYCLPLHFAFDMDVTTARLQTWARILRLPILLPTLDGGWREEKADGGRNLQPKARHPRFYLASRKPLLSYFRDVGRLDPERKVAGREMIARD